MSQDLEKSFTPPSLVAEKATNTSKDDSASDNKWKQVREAGKNSDSTISASQENIQPDNTANSDWDDDMQKLEKEKVEESQESSEVNEINIEAYAKLQQAHDALQEKYESAIKALADKHNDVRRFREEIEKVRRYAGLETIKEFFGLLDSLEAAEPLHHKMTLGKIEEESQNIISLMRTVEQMEEGRQSIFDLLNTTFKKLGVIAIEPAVGEIFNPDCHSAIATEAPRDPTQLPNTIVKLMRKGYRLHERIMRPAMVVVVQEKE